MPPANSGGDVMFVITVKFSKKKAIAILVALAVVLAAIVLLARGLGNDKIPDSGGPVAAAKLKTNDDRVAYLSSLGWEVNPECLSEKTVTIPKEFSNVFSEYNKLQQKQGFDLGKYKGVEVERYTYKVINYPDSTDEIEIALFVKKGVVIGGDIHSTALDGFIHEIK